MLRNHAYRAVQSVRSFNGPVWALVDQGWISLLNFATIVLLARHFPDDTFGAFILAYTVLLVVTAMQHAGITQAHHNLIARGTAQYARFLTGSVIVTQSMISAGASILVLLAAGAFQLAGQPAAAGLAVTLAIAMPFWLGQDMVRRLLYSERRTGAAFINDVVSYGGQLLGILWLVSATAPWSMGPGSPLLFLGLSSLLACLLGAWQLRHSMSFGHIRARRHMVIVRQIARFGSWMSAAEFMKWAGRHGSTWLVTLVGGVSLLGPFRAILHLVNILNPLKLAAFAYLPTHAAAIHERQGDAALRRWLLSRTALVGVPYALLASGVLVFGDELISLFYGTRFADVPAMTILALGVGSHAVHFGRSMVQMGLVAQQRTRLVLSESILSIVIMGTIGLALLMAWSLPGILLGEIITAGLLLAFNAWFFVRRTRPEPMGDTDVAGGQGVVPGHEALVVIRKQEGTVCKRHFQPEHAATEFDRLTRIHTGLMHMVRTDRAPVRVRVPRPISLDAPTGAFTMSYEPGLPVQFALERGDAASYRDIGRSMAEGVNDVHAIEADVLPDFGPHNVLWDKDTGGITLIDFGPGQSGDVPMDEPDQMLAHIAIRLAHPRRLFRLGMWERYMELLAGALSIPGPDVRLRRERALEKVLYDSSLGPLVRRVWMRLVAPAVLARIVRSLP